MFSGQPHLTSPHTRQWPPATSHQQPLLPAPCRVLERVSPRQCHISLTSSLKSELPGWEGLDGRVIRPSWSSQNLISVITDSAPTKRRAYWQLRLSRCTSSSRFTCRSPSCRGSETLHLLRARVSISSARSRAMTAPR